MGNNVKILSLMIVLFLALSALFFMESFGTREGDRTALKKFSSYEDMKNFVKTAELQGGFYGDERILGAAAPEASAQQAAKGGGSEDYSRTNIQVEGVDEADIIKSDGKYLYIVSGQSLVIIDAYPADSAKILATVGLNGTAQELFVNGNRIVVFGYSYDSAEPTALPVPDKTASVAVREPGNYPYYRQKFFMKVFDASSIESPEMKKDLKMDADYYDSRMIGDYVYVIVSQPMELRKDTIPLPLEYVSGTARPAFDYDDVYYFDYPDYAYRFTDIISLNIKDDAQELSHNPYLLGYAQNLFVSQNNIYITGSKHVPQSYFVDALVKEAMQKTVVHKISVKDGKVEYKSHGEVPGTPLNQFSMDEHNGYFRIATTTTNFSGVQTTVATKVSTVPQPSNVEEPRTLNHIYVLDENMNIAGKLEDLAPDERIYSARFIGERAYLVTFRQIDPLFVIDLKDPANPKVLGKLKIPGVSDYLHPYDENHIIGIGKEAVEAKEGNFAWFQGVKLALFDVSDVENPVEKARFVVGNRGTDSEALRDHKAFLFEREKKLLVIPILLAEINEEQYPNGVPDSAYGEYTFQGAYVFELTKENGFVLRGRVTHVKDDSLEKSGYYYFSPYSIIRRSLYIGNNLYTLSGKMIKINDLSDLKDVKEIELPHNEAVYAGEPAGIEIE